MITLKFNNVEFRSQTEKQIDETQTECTSHFMTMTKTIIGRSAKSEMTSIECKQNPAVNELIGAKINMKQ